MHNEYSLWSALSSLLLPTYARKKIGYLSTRLWLFPPRFVLSLASYNLLELLLRPVFPMPAPLKTPWYNLHYSATLPPSSWSLSSPSLLSSPSCSSPFRASRRAADSVDALRLQWVWSLIIVLWSLSLFPSKFNICRKFCVSFTTWREQRPCASSRYGTF